MMPHRLKATTSTKLCHAGIFFSVLSFHFQVLAFTDSIADKVNQLVEYKEDKTVYSQRYFAVYSPNTALDMVNQLPGFTLNITDKVRGFGQSNNNYLINGKRPSSKTEEMQDPLRRIVSSSVCAVEVLKTGSNEVAGYTGLVANVITCNTSELTGTWSTSLGSYSRGEYTPSFDVSLNKQLEQLSINTEFRYFRNHNITRGNEQYFDAENIPLILRKESYWSPSDNYRLNTAIKWQIASTKTINADLSLGYSYWRLEEYSTHFDITNHNSPETEIRATRYTPKNDWFPLSISGDYTQPLFSGQLKIMALHSYDYRKRRNYYVDENGDAVYKFASYIPTTRKESILRAVYQKPVTKHSIEYGIETAFNSLATNPDFYQDIGNGRERLTVTGSEVNVEEQRIDGHLLYTHHLNASSQIQVNLAAESSRIEVKQIAGSRRTYVRPKGFVSLQMPLNDDTNVQWRLSKHIEQLNFLDFTSFVTPSEGTSNVGNTDLVPEQKWRMEQNIDHSFNDNNKVSLLIYKDFVKDKVAYIPINGTQEGIGNLDSSYQYGISSTLTTELASLGLTGSKLDMSLEYNQSKLTDPVTGKSRPFDNQLDWRYQLKLRQDIVASDWAWTLSLSNFQESEGYRINQKNHYNESISSELSIENKDFYGFNFQFKVEDILEVDQAYTRSFYQQTRNELYTGKEHRVRQREQKLTLSISSTF